MAFRIDTAIIRGEVNNEVRDQVTGKIWLEGYEDSPLILDLTGNCHRDLAGCHLTFRNPDVKAQNGLDQLDTRQRGSIGDMTASRRVKVPTVSEEELSELVRKKEPIPTCMGNCLYLEWFSESNGRVVIESTEFETTISEAQWTLSEAEQDEQIEENTRQMRGFIDSVAKRIDRDDDECFDDDDRPLDEFEWEERLRESDRITDAYMEALEKYRDDPDQEQRVAEAMGWEDSGGEDDAEWSEGSGLDGGDEPFFDPSADEDGDEPGDIFSFGGGAEDIDDEDIDWEERHPLYERMHNFSIRLHREAQEKGYMDTREESGAESITPVQNLVFAAMELGAKLAGALNGLSRGLEPEPGLVIAWLKRGLPIVDRALSACEQALAEFKADADWIGRTRTEFFEVRAGMLDLIQEFRKQIP